MFAFFLTDSTLYFYKRDVTSFAMLLESLQDTMEIGLKYNPLATYGSVIWILIISFVVFSLIILNKIVNINQIQTSRHYAKRLALLMVTFLGLFLSPFTLNAENALTFKTPADKNLFVQKFGSTTYHMKDIATFANNSIRPILFSQEYIDQIESNFDPTPGEQSSLYGSLTGRNIILIQCETCEEYAYSRTYTPNYYRLYDEGIHFDNFYSAAKSNYTYDAELKALTSMMYFQADNFMYSYGENQFNNALPYILAENGYSANAFHNYEGIFFNRNVIYPNMGFEHFYADESLPVTADAYLPLDSVMFDAFKDLIVPVQDHPFFSFVITVTPHGPHKKYRDELSIYYDQLALDPLYADASIELLTLMAAQMDFDYGLGILLDDLETKDLLDETIIMIYSDHKNYSDYQMTEDLTPNSDIPFEIEKVPFLIYDQSLGSGTSTLITSQYDITPTLFDLLGISYIQYYYYGQSMFLDERKDSPIIFSYTSWMSYENVVMFDQIESGNDDPEDYLTKKQFIYDTIDRFEKMFQTDYFKDKTTYIPN
ncbi:MAG: LTA synthase family protein [Acholeplasmataceae bacterium]|nr:LTA synthase family protein [Acholeplasmataceae bacterium]